MSGSAAMNKAHDMLAELEGDLFSLADKVEELLGPVMDAIHILEADQPMLPYFSGLYDNLEEHFMVFSADNPDLATGEVPIDKRKKNAAVEAITLLESFQQDRKFMWRPVMSAAAVLDPLNWRMGKYHVPVQKYGDTIREELSTVVKAFDSNSDTCSGEAELIALALHIFERKYTDSLDQ